MARHSIALLGGTGTLGKGLAYLFAAAGHAVVIGSRVAGRAEEAAADLHERLDRPTVRGAANDEAARDGDVVILAVPWDGHDALLEELRPVLEGKIVVSCVNPLGFDEHGPYGLDVPAGSAAEHAAELLPESTVVGAFHHLPAKRLLRQLSVLHDQDVLVCGDDVGAKQLVMSLCESVVGGPGLDAGRLRMARSLEPLTAVLISVNKAYKAHSGIAVTGLRR